jgi:hypothetical protein
MMHTSNRSSVAAGVMTRQNDQRQPLRGAAFCARFSGHAHRTDGVINRQHLSRAVFMHDTNQVKAIETYFGGFKFRSRLEARYAVFFDELNLDFEYEPEGYSGTGWRYLPDFRLSQLSCFAEVKPSRDLISVSDLRKVVGLATEGGANVVLFIGEPHKYRAYLFNYLWTLPFNEITEECDVDEPTVDFIMEYSTEVGLAYDCVSANLRLTHREFNPRSTYVAGKKAQQARFEFGQTPERKVRANG